MQNWSWTKSVQKSNRNQFWDGLGLYLGGVWGRLGSSLAAFGRLLAVFWASGVTVRSTLAVNELIQDQCQRSRRIDSGSMSTQSTN